MMISLFQNSNYWGTSACHTTQTFYTYTLNIYILLNEHKGYQINLETRILSVEVHTGHINTLDSVCVCVRVHARAELW